MKRRLWIGLVLVLLIALLCCGTAMADASGSCGTNLTWTLTDAGVLTIRGTGPMTDYQSETDVPWYENKTDITSIVIENGVTHIGAVAFQGCWGATGGVTIPTSVKSIGNFAFTGCNGLTSLTIPNSVTRLEPAAFSYCGSITSITIPDSITTIEENVFDNCRGLTSVTIPTSVTSIGNYAFSGCDSLTRVSISNSVTDIGEGVFLRCRSLASVSIPNPITTIGNKAFLGCRSLISMTIPNSVTNIGTEVFYDCKNLSSVTILNSDVVIGDNDYDVFESCASSLIIHGWTGSTAEAYANAADVSFRSLNVYEPTLFLPASLTTIDSESLAGVAAKGVVIPDSVTEIAYDAFHDSQVATIYGYAGSAAETFCATHPEFTFLPIDDEWMADQRP